MDRNQSLSRYRCPVCASPLFTATALGSEDSLICTEESCSHSKIGFPIYNSIPYLLPIGQEFCVASEVMLPVADEPTGGYAYRVTSSSRIKRRIFFQRLFYGLERAEQLNYEAVCELAPLRPRVLVIGGGNTDTSSSSALYWVRNLLRKDAEFEVTDIYYSPYVNCVSDAHYLPYDSHAFDLVIITTVLEHVVEPSKVASEIYRILADGGVVYATVPFVQCVHEGAYDFSRFSLSGQRWLFRDFVEVSAGSFAGAFQSTLYNLSVSIQSLLRLPGSAVLIRILLWRFCQLLDRLLPANARQDVSMCNYFVGLKNVSSDKLLASDLVNYYRAKSSR